MSLTTILRTKNSSLLLHFCLYFSYLFCKYSQIKYKTFYNLIMSHFCGSIFMLSGLSQPPRCPSYCYSSCLKEKICKHTFFVFAVLVWRSTFGQALPSDLAALMVPRHLEDISQLPACPSLCLCISCPWAQGTELCLLPSCMEISVDFALQCLSFTSAVRRKAFSQFSWSILEMHSIQQSQ